MGRGKIGENGNSQQRGARGHGLLRPNPCPPHPPGKKQDITGMLTSSEEGSIQVYFCGKRELAETQGVAHISRPADAATPPQISVLAA